MPTHMKTHYSLLKSLQTKTNFNLKRHDSEWGLFSQNHQLTTTHCIIIHNDSVIMSIKHKHFANGFFFPGFPIFSSFPRSKHPCYKCYDDILLHLSHLSIAFLWCKVTPLKVYVFVDSLYKRKLWVCNDQKDTFVRFLDALIWYTEYFLVCYFT